MESIVLLNGAFVAESQACVSVSDGGWLHGAGLFETMRAERRVVFRLTDHLARLRSSAEKLLSPLDPSFLPSAEAIRELMGRNELVDARIRLTVTAGSMRGQTGDNAQPAMTVCTTAGPLASYPPEFYERGVAVVISPYRQGPLDPLSGHKTTNYLPRLLALRSAQAHRCAEALWFTHHNLLAEGSISNVFLVQGGRLRTPPADTPVLAGIARAVVMEEAGRMGIEAEVKPLTIDDLLGSEEVLLTSSIMQVLPVVRVERHDVGGGRPGPLSRKLFTAYRERVVRECHGAV